MTYLALVVMFFVFYVSIYLTQQIKDLPSIFRKLVSIKQCTPILGVRQVSTNSADQDQPNLREALLEELSDQFPPFAIPCAVCCILFYSKATMITF